MSVDTLILQADRGLRLRAAIPALILIVCLSVVALWLSIAFGPVGLIAVFVFIVAGVVLFFMRTTSVALSVSNDAVVVRNTLRTTRVPVSEVEGMALTPEGELQVLTKKRVVVVEVADGRAEQDVEMAAEQTMDEVERLAPADETEPYASAYSEAPSTSPADVYTGEGGDR